MNAAVKQDALALVEQDDLVTGRLPAVREQQAVALSQNSPAAIMMQALSSGVDLAQVEKMMELQERWEKREAEKAFRDAFAAFRGENIIIPKTLHVDRGRAGSFVQAEYDEVCRRLSPALSRHGFSFRHDQKFGSRKWSDSGVESDIAWVYVTCYLEHKAGHVETLSLEGPPDDLSANTPTQNMQATASYLKRQSLLAITGTATGGEDDENKLRRKTAGQDEGGTEDKVLNDGQAAAMEGMEKLTAWWATLTPKDRNRLSKEFTKMRQAARAADEEAGRG
jgi:hypothetical protein